MFECYMQRCFPQVSEIDFLGAFIYVYLLDCFARIPLIPLNICNAFNQVTCILSISYIKLWYRLEWIRIRISGVPRILQMCMHILF